MLGVAWALWKPGPLGRCLLLLFGLRGLFKDWILHTQFSQDHISDQGTVTFRCTALYSDHSLLKSNPIPQWRALKGSEDLSQVRSHSEEGAGLGPSSSQPLAGSFDLVGP